MTNEQLEAIRKLLPRWQGAGGGMLLSTQGEHVAVIVALLAEVDRLRAESTVLIDLNEGSLKKMDSLLTEMDRLRIAVQQERGACAAIADEEARIVNPKWETSYEIAAQRIAAAIRQRGASHVEPK